MKIFKYEFSLSFPLLGYALKRMVIFLPTLFIISLLTFILISSAPGDPAETMLNRNTGGEGQASDKLASDQAYQELKHRLGLDLPVFYISLGSLASCDTINKISKRDHRENLERLIYTYGNWDQISNYYKQVNKFELTILNIKRDSLTADPLIELRNNINRFYINYSDPVLSSYFTELDALITPVPALAVLNKPLQDLKSSYATMKEEKTTWKRYVPTLNWSGTKNQYHRWLFGDAKWIGKEEDFTKSRGFVRGDFGISYFSKRPVKSIIWDGLQWTFLISIISIIIQYIVSIPIGVYSAVNKDSRADSVITTTLFVLYSLPSFWIGTLLIFFLGGGDYLDIFPPFGLGDTDITDGLFVRFSDLSYHLVLPLFCYTYGSFAYLSRQMRGGMLSVLRQDFIRTANAKGLSKKTVIWKHAFRNSLLPIITIFAYVFPALIGGSIIIEYLFTIPGLGSITYQAVVQKDYPMVLTTTMFAAILTLVGYLVADILYAAADPRISYSKKAG
ncbi:MAG: ABC transporter permease [Bacteroidetes bacterium]|nr:ABC transporter permease [Bacteroidota bacterium]